LEGIELSDRRTDKLLRYHLKLKDIFEEMEIDLKNWINKEMASNEDLNLVKTIPGIRDVFGPVIVLEIDDINRFPNPPHLHHLSEYLLISGNIMRRSKEMPEVKLRVLRLREN
jgi:transposase